MTICRYFLQGNCRFGDRCRFEHTYPASFYEGETPKRGNYNDYSNRSSYNAGYNRRNYNSYENKPSYSYGESDYTPQEDRYHPDYNDYNQRYTSEKRYQSDRHGSGTYESENTYGQKTRFSQNRHEWVSDDYKRQRDQRRGTEGFYDTSTPKSSVNFSFREPELPKKVDHSVENEQNLVYAEIIKEDIKAWEEGSQWPFTCYSPIQERSSFPGFVDVSPEELRYETYKARENNIYESFLESVEKALQNINARRNQLKIPTAQLISVIEKYRAGQNVSTEDEVDGVFPFSISKLSPIEDMLADESSLQQSSAASFSFKLPPQNGSSFKTVSSNFSFKLPSASEIKQSSQTSDIEMYTPLERLSSADKEQFSASTFTLGKIPTVPPPQEMCF